ncbi:MAG: hypothetical protein R6W67_10195 [Bacteroidales bacterium]
MKGIKKILFILALMIFSSFMMSAQTVTVVNDTMKVRVETKSTVSEVQGNQKGNIISQRARRSAGDNPSKAIKQVKGAKPDMSKAKGARPPVVIRPGGTAIPKGVGKPTGVGRKGGR